MRSDTLLGAYKTLETTLPAQGVTTIQQQTAQSRCVHHLLYATPVKRGEDICVIEDIVPLYDVAVKVRLPQKIKKAYLAPQMDPLPITQQDGTCATPCLSSTVTKWLCWNIRNQVPYFKNRGLFCWAEMRVCIR